MPHLPHTALPCAYRSSERHDEHLWLAAAHPLREAGEALSLAILSLEDEGNDEASTGARLRRAAQARSFLVEAALALGRARIFVPTIRGYSVPVIMAVDADIEGELGRLHQLATRMLWYNHALLPARGQGLPMRPEDEAQLATMVRGLARTARLDRALRHAWIGMAAAVAVLTPTLGMVAVAVLMVTMVTIVAVVAAVQLAGLLRSDVTPSRG